ncbi:phosphate/phosphite/phosphonate ABC transporter substrate-binding protein [Mycolicibacterium sp. jd]|uniref:phosphate/phosphite/phosphonate ABC transporter substrate-binding protein n=1 Tax=unclassified Mycolicibacterium TaxID=2636767 RepID=UPI00351B5090
MTALVGCSGGEAAPDSLKFAVPPGEASNTLEEMRPVADVVEAATGLPVELTQTSDYLAVTEAMRSGLVDVALYSPMPTVVSRKVGNVEPVVAALGAPYKSDIICSPDADVDKLGDIAGKSIAFVDPGSTSGNYIPKLMLKNAGVDVEALDATYAGGHDVSALSVKKGSTDCAAVASLVLPDLVKSGTIAESDYELVAESDPIPISLVVVVRGDLDPELKEQIRAAYLDSQAPEVLKVTGATRFVPAEDADWTMFEDAAQQLGINLEQAK